MMMIWSTIFFLRKNRLRGGKINGKTQATRKMIQCAIQNGILKITKWSRNMVLCFWNFKILNFYQRQKNCNFHWLLSKWWLCNDVRLANGLKFKNAKRFDLENKSFRILEFTWWNLEKCCDSQINYN